MTAAILPAMPMIVGVARSGTTLLRMMCNAHPELCIPPETGFIPRMLALTAQGDKLREQFFETITQFPTWGHFNLAREECYQTLKAIEPFTIADGVRAFYRLCAERRQKRRWGDKTPLYCLHLEALQALLPEARFVHIIRDGRDVAVSVRGLWFAPGKDPETIAHDWCARIRAARAAARRCSHYMEIRYEDLVRRPAEELQRLCRFIDLPYHECMLRYHGSVSALMEEVKTQFKPDGTVLITREAILSQHRFLAQPPEPSRISRWKQAMSDDFRVRFEAVAGGLLDELGYERGPRRPWARSLVPFLKKVSGWQPGKKLARKLRKGLHR